MNLKQRIVSFGIFVSGVLGLKNLSAQEQPLDANCNRVENPIDSARQARIAEVGREQYLAEVWAESDAGKKAIDAYKKAMNRIGEPAEVAQTQLKYLMALSKMDRSLFFIGETDHVFDKEDLQAMKPDSLAKEIGKLLPQAITPDKYPGRFCGHAGKYWMLLVGAAPEFSGLGSAYEAIDMLRQNDNFREINTQIEQNPQDVTSLPLGIIKVYKPTKAHPHGHIGTSDENGRDSSDKLRNMIDLNNYSGIVCFATAGYKVGEMTFYTIMAEELKKEELQNVAVLDTNDDLKAIRLNTINPEAVFKFAVTNSENALLSYNQRLGDLTTKQRAAFPYVLSEAKRIPLVAAGAKRAKVKTQKRAPARRLAQNRRSPRGASRGRL